MELLHYIFLLTGMGYLITQSLIMRPLRKLVAKAGAVPAAFIYCPSCTGFWIGLALTPYWPFESSYLGSAISATALMALWKEYGPQINPWMHEQAPTEVQRQVAFAAARDGND
jgi:hypothetical protein